MPAEEFATQLGHVIRREDIAFGDLDPTCRGQAVAGNVTDDRGQPCFSAGQQSAATRQIDLQQGCAFGIDGESCTT